MYHLRNIAAPLCLVLSISAGGFAANVESARITYNSTSQRVCTGDNCAGAGKATLSALHAFDIPATTVQDFNENTSVTVSFANLQIPFKLSDDPKYVPGATSARITKTIPFEYDLRGFVQISAQLDWSGNRFQVNLKGKATGDFVVTKATPGRKTLSTELTTHIQTPSVAPYTKSDELPVDYISNMTYTESPTGDSTKKQNFAFKSVQLIN